MYYLDYVELSDDYDFFNEYVENLTITRALNKNENDVSISSIVNRLILLSYNKNIDIIYNFLCNLNENILINVEDDLFNRMIYSQSILDCLLSHDLYKNIVSDEQKKIRNKMLTIIQNYMWDCAENSKLSTNELIKVCNKLYYPVTTNAVYYIVDEIKRREENESK